MNSHNRYFEQQNSENYHEYNLWQNSRFSNSFNLQCAFQEVANEGDTNGWTEEPLPHVDNVENCDDKSETSSDINVNKTQPVRIVSKDSLYKDPNSFYGEEIGEEPPDPPPPPIPPSADNDWTQLYWQRAGSSHAQQQPRKSAQVKGSFKGKKMQDKLTEALARPVQISKAESMMQKMGWQGGPLGKTGEGIVEPIAPNAVYSTSTMGFGHRSISPPTPKKPSHRKARKFKLLKQKTETETFETNVLLHILEFVKNDNEVEIIFDKLFKKERLLIHSLVNEVISGETTANNLDHMDIVEEINTYNNYVLATQSEGEHPNRQLHVYKEAPEHIYLITPDDLKDDANTDKTESDKINQNNEIKNDSTSKTSNSVTTSSNKPKTVPDKATTTPINVTTNPVKVSTSPTKVATTSVKVATTPTKLAITSDKVSTASIKSTTSVKATSDATDASNSENNQGMDVDEETNPFLRSITRNLKNNYSPDENISEKFQDCNLEKKPELRSKIMEYFIEFLDDVAYTEFRFLGPFDRKEIAVIDRFIDDVSSFLGSNIFSEEYVEVEKRLKSAQCRLEVKDDCNGSAVIYKLGSKENRSDTGPGCS